MEVLESIDFSLVVFFMEKIAPGGFEPPSTAPKAAMLDRYTTGLSIKEESGLFIKFV